MAEDAAREDAMNNAIAEDAAREDAIDKGAMAGNIVGRCNRHKYVCKEIIRKEIYYIYGKKGNSDGKEI